MLGRGARGMGRGKEASEVMIPRATERLRYGSRELRYPECRVPRWNDIGFPAFKSPLQRRTNLPESSKECVLF